MARAIARIALVALGLSGRTFHEPFHGPSKPQRRMLGLDAGRVSDDLFDRRTG
jgi:hypothetical protein